MLINILILLSISSNFLLIINGQGLVNRIQSDMIQRSSEQVKIDDTDYWDNDDFVPYKNDRHDMFDWRLLKAILLHDSNNVILSPFSVKLLLVLLSEAAGPDTSTQRELLSVLPTLKSPILKRELYRKILNSLKEKNDNYDLNIGTKIYVNDYIKPRQRYSAIVSSHYDAEIESLNFQRAPETANLINNWCKNVTNGHIKDLVTQDDVKNSVMLLINAIYFDGKWRKPFLTNNTFELPFFTTPSNQIRAQFMTQTANFYYFYSSKLNAKIIRLPYKGKKFSMTILLPSAKDALDNLIYEVEGDNLKRLQWLMDETLVKVSIPKFKFDYSSNLNMVLQSLGITEMFSDHASLPGLDRGSTLLNNKLKVSNVIQKAGLIVSEKGTTAFAATEVSIDNKFGSKTEEFNANRPFVFFIEDESTGNLLFAGKVTDPTK